MQFSRTLQRAAESAFCHLKTEFPDPVNPFPSHLEVDPKVIVCQKSRDMSPQQTIAHYGVISKLGDGGMGEVGIRDVVSPPLAAGESLGRAAGQKSGVGSVEIGEVVSSRSRRSAGWCFRRPGAESTAFPMPLRSLATWELLCTLLPPSFNPMLAA
jgi:hypothetical protein